MEAAFYAVILLVCLAVLVSAMGLPGSLREPLGSAAVPKGVAVLIAAFCIMLLRRTLHDLRTCVQSGSDAANSAKTPSPASNAGGAVLKTCLIITVYAALLTWPIIPSAVTTPVFLFILIMALSSWTWKNFCWAIALSILFGEGLHYLFQNYLFVNLP